MVKIEDKSCIQMNTRTDKQTKKLTEKGQIKGPTMMRQKSEVQERVTKESSRPARRQTDRQDDQ